MDGYTYIDLIVIVLIMLSTYLAWVRGGVRETLSIGGWIISSIAAFALAPKVQPMMASLPFVGTFIESSCTFSMLGAFVLVFVAALIIISIFTPIISGAIQESALSIFDKGLGFVFGFARGLLLIAIVYLLYDALVPQGDQFEILAESQTIGFIQQTADFVHEKLPSTMPPWLETRIQALMGECTGASVPTTTAS